MVKRVVTRSERRMERKSALVLLGLILAVSLVSFGLGVLVGQSGHPEVPAPPPAAERERVPVEKKAPQAVAPAEKPAPAKPANAGLTFFDTLPQGQQPPLGSGINLPPQGSGVKKPTAVESSRTESPAVPKVVSTRAVEDAGTAPDGDYVVQVASFRKAEEAHKLSQRLLGGGYAAYTQEADLGEKGTWHRVLVGPFAKTDDAVRTVERLQKQDKLSGIVKKR
ncbi:SPOR domain-containing protein [uncultured Desulfuromonas sp.]|uniref:SPOR domain-containing protein n=1 Tax=uncultured Desulfuromonas sp. TaxID=181013 RepID=UPI00260A3BA6|nr:SPOR domain-containing protein [uncultured Desulfuromonas sp.]